MRFDKEITKKKKRRVSEEHVGEEPTELESAVAEQVEKEPEHAAEETPAVVEEFKTKELYGGQKETGKEYVEIPTKKGYCELRERTKKIYGIKYAAGKGVDMARNAKLAILDWCRILPRKGDTKRKEKEDLV